MAYANATQAGQAPAPYSADSLMAALSHIMTIVRASETLRDRCASVAGTLAGEMVTGQTEQAHPAAPGTLGALHARLRELATVLGSLDGHLTRVEEAVGPGAARAEQGDARLQQHMAEVLDREFNERAARGMV